MKSDLEKILSDPAIQQANEILNDPAFQQANEILSDPDVQLAHELVNSIPYFYYDLPAHYLDVLSDLQNQLSAFDSSSNAGQHKTKELKSWVSDNKPLLSAIEQTYDDISTDQYDENSDDVSFVEESTQSIEELSDKLPISGRLKSKLKAAAKSLNYNNIKEVRDWLGFLLNIIGFINSIS